MRDISDCPTCGEPVDAVTAISGETFASPCGHKVEATIWPDRVELA